MKHKSIFLSLLGTLVFLGACEKKLQPVEVEIKDPQRHYYPVIQGELLGITYDIENTSDHPLFIQEIQTTCGCMFSEDKLPIVILPKQKGKVHFSYNSTKNTGYVEHFAWLYGNFADSLYRELKFDTNVVPPSDYTRDYEELYHQVLTRSSDLKDLVDGKSTEKGYYTDEGQDPRELNRVEMQKTIDDLVSF
ncbi:MAG: DUF1573 domain-containing protein [Muribaculaceae bacterium]|nr:DUF1573 domain-containing protein [Muribaculaceae bacterium]